MIRTLRMYFARRAYDKALKAFNTYCTRPAGQWNHAIARALLEEMNLRHARFNEAAKR